MALQLAILRLTLRLSLLHCPLYFCFYGLAEPQPLASADPTALVAPLLVSRHPKQF